MEPQTKKDVGKHQRIADQTPLVHLVDDDEMIRELLVRVLRGAGLEVRAYGDPLAFLEEFDPERPGCVILDVQMPGMTGIELQSRLAAFTPPPTLLLISGYASVPIAVEAMREGAFDFLTKPLDIMRLLDVVRRAIERDREWRCLHRQRQSVRNRYATLTPREREIFDDLLLGKMNKVIALEKGISVRTVDHHRARVMRKMEAVTLAELLQMAARIPVAMRNGSGCAPQGPNEVAAE